MRKLVKIILVFAIAIGILETTEGRDADVEQATLNIFEVQSNADPGGGGAG